MRLIDADALEDVLVNHGFYYCNESDYSDGVAWGFLLARDDVRETPTIEAEPVRHGKWIWEECVYKCSECSHKAYGNILECMDGTYKYCPNCGARMEIEENERKRANETNTTI